jgi:hypothetical protein
MPAAVADGTALAPSPEDLSPAAVGNEKKNC